MPRLLETRLVRLHHRRANVHLHEDQQWLQSNVAQWRQYLPPQPSLPGCQSPNKQKASASSNRNRSNRGSQCRVPGIDANVACAQVLFTVDRWTERALIKRTE